MYSHNVKITQVNFLHEQIIQSLLAACLKQHDISIKSQHKIMATKLTSSFSTIPKEYCPGIGALQGGDT